MFTWENSEYSDSEIWHKSMKVALFLTDRKSPLDFDCCPLFVAFAGDLMLGTWGVGRGGGQGDDAGDVDRPARASTVERPERRRPGRACAPAARVRGDGDDGDERE